MLMRPILELYDILDSSFASGKAINTYFEQFDTSQVEIRTMSQQGHATDYVKIRIPGRYGKTTGGTAPTLGILGRLGGLGARPDATGFVSDGDGALAVLAVASKLFTMKRNGDELDGDVIVATHICPSAPTMPHEPVPFMGSPVDMAVMNEAEVDGDMDAILSVDTTKGNRIINHRGFAISPTVKEGYILRISDDLLDIMQMTTGELPYTFPITIQDITPYGNSLYHLNSVLQPSTATKAPVVGVAITSESMVPGCATGATHLNDVEEAARFALETAKAFGKGKCRFYDEDEYQMLIEKYGSMAHIQTMGR